MNRLLLRIAACAITVGLFSACQPDPDIGDQTSKAMPNESAPVSFDFGESSVHVLLDGGLLTTFHYGSEWDKPFLYPLRTVSGIVVSRGYPIDPREGEESDHDWHRGIWYGHGDINGHDFWRELGRDRTGTLVQLSDPTIEREANSDRLLVELGLRSADGEIHGSVIQRFLFRADDSALRIDVDITFRADRGSNLRFGDTEDGGFAMRLSGEFRQERGAVLTNSEGLQGTENIWGREARWVDYSAVVAGHPAGVTILDHPSNLRHPSRWHARGYSLCSANPFGVSDFTGDPTADGSHIVPNGESLTLRYRVIIHEGGSTSDEIESWFQQFARD